MRWAALLAAVLVAVMAGAVATRERSGADVPDCSGAQALDLGCQASRVETLTRAEGPRAALSDLADRARDGGYVSAACHQLTHRIGRAAGARNGIAAFGDGEALCGSGYFHGVTEAVMAKLGRADSVRRADGVCASLGQRGGARATCIHGMGHGFMGVFDRDLGAALRGCDALAAGADRDGCYRGVFMENHATADRPSRDALRPDEPLYPCTAVARRYKRQCYERQSTYALFVSDQDFAAVFRICAGAERAFRGACRQGLGGDVVAETEQVPGRRAQALARRRLCMLGGSTRARTDCITGAAGQILQDLDGGPAQLDAFCASLSAVRTQPEHAACLSAGERAYRRMLAEQTGGAVRSAPIDFVCHLKKEER